MNVHLRQGTHTGDSCLQQGISNSKYEERLTTKEACRVGEKKDSLVNRIDRWANAMKAHRLCARERNLTPQTDSRDMANTCLSVYVWQEERVHFLTREKTGNMGKCGQAESIYRCTHLSSLTHSRVHFNQVNSWRVAEQSLNHCQ